MKMFSGDGFKFSEWVISMVDICYKQGMGDQQQIFVGKILEDRVPKEVKHKAKTERGYECENMRQFVCWLAERYAKPVPPEVEADRVRKWNMPATFSYSEVSHGYRYLSELITRANCRTTTVNELEVARIIQKQLPAAWADYYRDLDREFVARKQVHGWFNNVNNLMLWTLNVLKDKEARPQTC